MRPFELTELRAKLSECSSPLSKSNDILLLRSFYPQLVIGAARKRRDEMLKHIKPSMVLDVGCGRGWLSVEVAKHDCHVVAVDLSRIQIREARALVRAEKVNIPLEPIVLADPGKCSMHATCPT
jgi:2-polyprenyl-3-methyl-5-hydroxy-6-metoxy-1,4-benzoquinol methylase